MKRIIGSAVVLVAAGNVLGQGFAGPYQLDQWETPGIDEGRTAIGRLPADHIQLRYDVDLGNPGDGVSYREAEYSSIAETTGVIGLDWTWTGFHAFFESYGSLRVFSTVGGEVQEIELVPHQDVPADFDFSGTVAIPVEAGMPFGVIVGGENFDSNSVITGEVTLSAMVGFHGPYEPQHWVDSGIPDGVTMLTPPSGQTDTLAYSYDVDLGNPGPGVTPREASIGLTAPQSGVVSFDWHWAGFHSFFESYGGLVVIVDGSEGNEVIELVAYQDTPADFEYDGSASFEVEEGFGFEIVVMGENFDSNSAMNGVVTLSNFAPPTPADFLPLAWLDEGVLEGETEVGHDLSTPSDGAVFQYEVDLGNPGPGVPYRETTFSAIAAAAGQVSFDWRWAGFHSFFASNGVLQAFVNDEVFDLVPYGDVGVPFEFTGESTLKVEAGDAFGLLVGGDNFDSNSYLSGSIFVTDLVVSCLADYNGDGVLNILDFVAFQAGWSGQDADADCNGDGLYNILDFVCFQNAFGAGCP